MLLELLAAGLRQLRGRPAHNQPSLGLVLTDQIAHRVRAGRRPSPQDAANGARSEPRAPTLTFYNCKAESEDWEGGARRLLLVSLSPASPEVSVGVGFVCVF